MMGRRRHSEEKQRRILLISAFVTLRPAATFNRHRRGGQGRGVTKNKPDSMTAAYHVPCLSFSLRLGICAVTWCVLIS